MWERRSGDRRANDVMGSLDFLFMPVLAAWCWHFAVVSCAVGLGCSLDLWIIGFLKIWCDTHTHTHTVVHDGKWYLACIEYKNREVVGSNALAQAMCNFKISVPSVISFFLKIQKPKQLLGPVAFLELFMVLKIFINTTVSSFSRPPLIRRIWQKDLLC